MTSVFVSQHLDSSVTGLIFLNSASWTWTL